MAIYREKPTEPEVIEAIEWTGENLDEVKEFLGDCFVEVNFPKLWYRPCRERDFITWVTPGDMLYPSIAHGDFSDEAKKDFLEDWELIEEEE